MRLQVLFYILGKLLSAFSIFLFLFFIIGFTIYDNKLETISFLYSGLLTFFVGFAFNAIAKKSEHTNVYYKEALASSGLGWILIVFFASLPFYISSSIPSFADAYFESMSGSTTTGATILDNIEGLSELILLWRSFLQWLGGLGIIVLSMALFPAIGVRSNNLLRIESTAYSMSSFTPKLSQIIRAIYSIYILFTILLFLLLKIGGMNTFEAICHAFAGISTGGFSPLNNSIGQYSQTGDPSALYYQIVLVTFMLLMAINFSIYYNILFRRKNPIWKNIEFRYYFCIVVLSIILVTMNLYFHKQYDSLGKSLQNSLFTVASIGTTTGYVTEDYNQWPMFSKAILLVLMIIGGMSGSTSGGFLKTIRFVYIIKSGFLEIYRTIQPKSVLLPRIKEDYISRNILNEINSHILLIFVVFFAGFLIISTANYDFETSVFMVIATLGNIGPGFGLVGPVENYQNLPGYAKWTLSALMLFGRLEILPIAVLFSSRLWRK